MNTGDNPEPLHLLPKQPSHTHASRLEWVVISGKFKISNEKTGTEIELTAVRRTHTSDVTRFGYADGLDPCLFWFSILGLGFSFFPSFSQGAYWACPKDCPHKVECLEDGDFCVILDGEVDFIPYSK